MRIIHISLNAHETTALASTFIIPLLVYYGQRHSGPTLCFIPPSPPGINSFFSQRAAETTHASSHWPQREQRGGGGGGARGREEEEGERVEGGKGGCGEEEEEEEEQVMRRRRKRNSMEEVEFFCPSRTDHQSTPAARARNRSKF